MNVILGEKKDQTQFFDKDGNRLPITKIDVGECYLVDIKDKKNNGYWSLKLAFCQTKKIKKSIQGQLEKAGIKTPLRFLKEIRIEKYLNKILPKEEEIKKKIIVNGKEIAIGDKINPLFFIKPGDKVNVSGISKGKGFQGVVKRHHFHGGPRTHGQSDRERAPGSIGQTTTPGRVLKGKRMAGRMGGQRITVKNLEVIDVDEKMITVKGLVPGRKNGLLEIKKVV